MASNSLKTYFSNPKTVDWNHHNRHKSTTTLAFATRNLQPSKTYTTTAVVSLCLENLSRGILNWKVIHSPQNGTKQPTVGSKAIGKPNRKLPKVIIVFLPTHIKIQLKVLGSVGFSRITLVNLPPLSISHFMPTRHKRCIDDVCKKSYKITYSYLVELYVFIFKAARRVTQNGEVWWSVEIKPPVFVNIEEYF